MTDVQLRQFNQSLDDLIHAYPTIEPQLAVSYLHVIADYPRGPFGSPEISTPWSAKDYEKYKSLNFQVVQFLLQVGDEAVKIEPISSLRRQARSLLVRRALGRFWQEAGHGQSNLREERQRLIALSVVQFFAQSRLNHDLPHPACKARDSFFKDLHGQLPYLLREIEEAKIPGFLEQPSSVQRLTAWGEMHDRALVYSGLYGQASFAAGGLLLRELVDKVSEQKEFARAYGRTLEILTAAIDSFPSNKDTVLENVVLLAFAFQGSGNQATAIRDLANYILKTYYVW